MPKISAISEHLPASAIRKLVPLSEAAEAAGTKVYHLNIGAPDIKSPKCALDAVKTNSLDHISYSHSAGFKELRAGLSEKYYKKLGIGLDASEILVTVAGSEAISMALAICCNRGDEVIVMEPYYTNYNTFAIMNGVEFKAVPTDIRNGFKVPPAEEFEKLITDKTKAIFFNNPGNPTGTLYTKDEILELGDLARKYDLFLISDEVYREFCYTDEAHFSALNIPGAEENVILIDSVSKRYNLCGCRIGCIASHNKHVMSMALKYAQSRLSPPSYGQLAAIGALDTPPEYFTAVREEYIRRRDYTISTLNKMEGVFSPMPMGAFYTIAEIPVDDAETFARWMLAEFRLNNETTMVTPAASFYKTPGQGHHYIRVAYVLEVPSLKKALRALEEGLKVYPGRTI